MLTLNKCLLTELQGTKSFCKPAMSNITLQFKRWSVPYQSRDWQLTVFSTGQEDKTWGGYLIIILVIKTQISTKIQ